MKTTMEEELQKRNTDCVYFLASPLTCKKGIDCEYRHSEIARLNPRDCWYWWAGNCLNPTCGFRHPPLEKHAKSPSETILSSELANKTNIPCYFHFSSFCNKGDKCSFMHGDDPNIAAGKSGNMSSEVKEGISLDDKKRVVNDNVSSLKEANTNYLPEMVPKTVMDLKFQPKEDIQLANPNNIILRSPLQIAVSQGEEAVSLKSDSLLHADGFVRGRSLISTDQSSKLRVEDQVELEDRWESSPGFDILVEDESEDDRSENLFFHEDDQDCLLAFERGHRELIEKEHKELSNHNFGYDFEDMVEYDPAYCDAEVMYEGEIYDSFDCGDNICIIEDIGNCSACSSARTWGSLLSHKRKLLPVELAINDQRVVDLRDHLRNHRLVDGHQVCQLSRMNDSSRLLCRNRKWTQRSGISQLLHGRLASEVRKIAIESHVDDGTLFDGSNQRGFLRPSRSNRFRLQQKVKRLAKRQFFISEVPRRPVPKGRRFSQASTEFTGPKTLAQIKEEKKKTEANGDCCGKTGHSIRMALADFEGPKPLSEILKDKKKPGSGQECDGSTRDI